MKKLENKFDVLIEQKNTAEPSRLFGCDKIEVVDNHIFIYQKTKLIYKVWLKRNDYKELEEATKDAGMTLYRF